MYLGPRDDPCFIFYFVLYLGPGDGPGLNPCLIFDSVLYLGPGDDPGLNPCLIFESALDLGPGDDPGFMCHIRSCTVSKSLVMIMGLIPYCI